MPDSLSREQRSALMARVKTRDTAPEVALRRALWAAGVRGWRLHRPLPGKPDLVWQGRKVAVFVDGAFWHGHPDYYRNQSGHFWNEKIARNRERDKKVDAQLAALGYEVVRIWDFEVERQPETCVERILSALSQSPGRVVRGTR
jgi:DNA mismatch endonuclease (patch repair protein)